MPTDLAASAIDLFMIRSKPSVVVSGVKPSAIGLAVLRSFAVYELGPETLSYWHVVLFHLSHGPWMTGLLTVLTTVSCGTAAAVAPPSARPATAAAAAARSMLMRFLLRCGPAGGRVRPRRAASSRAARSRPP